MCWLGCGQWHNRNALILVESAGRRPALHFSHGVYTSSQRSLPHAFARGQLKRQVDAADTWHRSNRSRRVMLPDGGRGRPAIKHLAAQRGIAPRVGACTLLRRRPRGFRFPARITSTARRTAPPVAHIFPPDRCSPDRSLWAFCAGARHPLPVRTNRSKSPVSAMQATCGLSQ
jgi:hypothetical protein